MKILFFVFENLERYLCRALLISFVTLLFAQILSREIFGHSIIWSEELSVYLFVWFVFFGASYAAKLSAHNRVLFHHKWLPKRIRTFFEVLSDLSWIGFNSYFIYLSYDFTINKMNLFWKSQTLGIPMKYIYLILPIAFVFMNIRILQVNYLKFFKGVELIDPEVQEREELMEASKKEQNVEDCKMEHKK